MQVSSEFPRVADSVPSVFLVEGAPAIKPLPVEDEEFPSDLPTEYDWMLQPVSERASHPVLGFLAVIAVAVLIALSVLVFNNFSQSFPKVLASPVSSSSQ